MSAFYEWRTNLTGEGTPEEIVAQSVTSDFFGTMGAKPMLGRTFASEEGAAGHDQVVILGWNLEAAFRRRPIGGRPFGSTAARPLYFGDRPSQTRCDGGGAGAEMQTIATSLASELREFDKAWIHRAGADVVMTERVASHGDALWRGEFPLMWRGRLDDKAVP